MVIINNVLERLCENVSYSLNMIYNEYIQTLHAIVYGPFTCSPYTKHFPVKDSLLLWSIDSRNR